jgi:Ni/Co efflux regulator RcnB
MSKLLSTLIAVAFAAVSLSAIAAPAPSAGNTSVKPSVEADSKTDAKPAKKAKKPKKAKKADSK